MPRGIPQIEITYDVDANGILNVNATEKSSGKSEKITVQNEKGRLSAEDIQKMVDEAEEFKEDDNKQRERIEQRNALDSYIFSVKQSLNDEKLKDKFTEDDKNSIQDKIKEVQEWYDDNMEASKEDYVEKQKELESVFSPIMMRVYQETAPPQEQPMEQPTEQPTESNDDIDDDWKPEIDEVD